MQPLFQILANDKDITAKINNRLISITVTDERGLQSDSVNIELDDRDNKLALLPTGAELKIHLGKLSNDNVIQYVYMGKHIVDEIELYGPPETYQINAKAADMRKSLKQQKTRAWQDITMGDLVSKIAHEHGLKPNVDATLANIPVTHISQTEESDLHLLTRLAKEHDATAKPVNGYLVYIPQSKKINANGKNLKQVEVKKNQCSDWRITLADRSKYQSCICYYQDTDAAERTPVKVGNGEPVHTIRGTKKNYEDAYRKARSTFQKLSRGESVGDITIKGGDLTLMAETPIVLTGFRDGINAEWIITKATHKLAGDALTTTIEIETPET
jgi:hypothetical protein